MANAHAWGFYPQEWWQGRSGLFAPDYITPSFNNPGYLYSYGRGARAARSGKLVFAAATVDDYCQQDGSPRITILQAPPDARIATDIGSFIASANDGGSAQCVGRTVRGTRVYLKGRSGQIVLRVAYPTKGLTYDHVVSVR
jgi:hypothetical protein